MNGTMDVISVGHASFDVTMALAHHPAPDEKMHAQALDLAGGGPAANAAVQVARLGGRAGFCGRLGRDLPGELHLRELVREGVDTSLVARDDAPTPTSQILAKPDGARSVVNFRGDAPPMAADTRSPPPEAARVWLFDGHEPALSEALNRAARRASRITVLDAGSLRDGTRRLAGEVSVLAASETFARQWSGAQEPERMLAALRQANDCVVITLGAQGLIWARGGSCGRLPAFRVDTVDSTGAGDAFHGALAWALATGQDWRNALNIAQAAGALACTRLGARAGLAGREAVMALAATAAEHA
ncbi:MAG: PfkB family carbohydrate kinase [Mariprofundaceae bacterium]